MFKMLVFSFIVSLVIGLALGPFVIKELKKFHARQSEREEGPQSHKYKAGTPTMGGILILTALTVSCLIFDPMDLRKGLALFLALGHGVIGFLDDSIKAIKHHSLYPLFYKSYILFWRIFLIFIFNIILIIFCLAIVYIFFLW